MKLHHCHLLLQCFPNGSHLQGVLVLVCAMNWGRRHRSLIPFCHKRLAGLPLMSGEEAGKRLLRYVPQYCWQRHPTTANLHVTCCVVGDGCSRVLLHRHSHRFTSGLCNSAEMFQGAPRGGEMEGGGGIGVGGLGHMHGGSSLGLRACTFHVCLPSTCHGDLLLLFTRASAAHTLIWLPDERVTQS